MRDVEVRTHRSLACFDFVLHATSARVFDKIDHRRCGEHFNRAATQRKSSILLGDHRCFSVRDTSFQHAVPPYRSLSRSNRFIASHENIQYTLELAQSNIQDHHEHKTNRNANGANVAMFATLSFRN